MTSPKTLLKAWNFRPNKLLGQNFLAAPSLAERIVKLSEVSPEDVVLEIGAGLGALTIPLARIAKTVFAVEKDHRLIALLKTEILLNRLSNVKVMEQDILNLNIDDLAPNRTDKLIVAGNLPYNISSQILIKLLFSRDKVSRAIVMLQKELALRIIEPPGSKKYGRISVMLQYGAELKKIMEVKADQFFPKPKVDSVMLSINFKPKPDLPADNEIFLFEVLKAAFGQRRKTLKNALKGSQLHLEPKEVLPILEKAGINPLSRAESLDVQEFVRLSNVIKAYTTPIQPKLD